MYYEKKLAIGPQAVVYYHSIPVGFLKRHTLVTVICNFRNLFPIFNGNRPVSTPWTITIHQPNVPVVFQFEGSSTSYPFTA